MNVGALITNVGFKVDQASMQRVTSQTSHMARQIGYLIGAATAFEGIKNLLVYTGQMEMLSVQFGVLVGNMKEGRKIMGDIRQMASITPFETKELAGAVRLMMTFGAEAKNVLGYTSMLGDITMGDKVRFGQMSLAFSQMLAANKLMGQDLLQMVQGGYNPLKTIAEMRKISYDQALKMMAKDQIKPEMVIAAMQRDTTPGGKFYHGMLEGAKTMNGLWSTVSDNVKAVALLVGNMFSGGIKETMAGFINLLNDGMPMIQTFLGYLSQSFDRVGDAFKELGRVAMLITKNLAPLFLGMAHVASIAIESIKTAFIGILWALAPFIDALINTFMQIFAVFDVYVADSGNVLVAYGKILGGVRDIAILFGESLKAVAPIVIFVTSLVSALVDVIGFLSAGVDFLVRNLNGLDVMIVPMTLLAGAFAAMGIAAAAGLAPILATVAAFFALYQAQIAITESLTMAGYIGTQQDIDRITAQRKLNDLKRQGKDLDARAARGEDVSRLQKGNRLSQGAVSGMISANGGTTDTPMGIMSGFTDALGQFKGTGDSELNKLISGMERAMAKFNIKQNNTVNVSTQVDDKGKTQLSPEALAHSLNKAARSLFDIQLVGVRQISL